MARRNRSFFFDNISKRLVQNTNKTAKQINTLVAASTVANTDILTSKETDTKISTAINSTGVNTLSDISVANVVTDQVLQYNANTGNWENETLSLVSSVDGLTDTNLSSVQTNDYLQYDGSNWINSALDLSSYVTNTDIADYSNTAQMNTAIASSNTAMKNYVDAEVSGIVNSAPTTLDTLNELAAALGDDANFSATTATSLGNRLRIDVSNQSLTGAQKTNALTNLGITATVAELNYVDGVTSNIQTQLDAKATAQQLSASGLNNTDDLGSGSSAPLSAGWYAWGSSQPSNSPDNYAMMYQLNDGGQPQQWVMAYGGAANSVDLYARRRTSSAWDTTWTKFWNSTDFTSTNVSNWNTAYTYSQVGHLPLSGGTLTGDLFLGSNTVHLGTNGLRLYQDSSNYSRIISISSSTLYIQGNSIYFTDTTSGENYVRMIANGTVRLYYDNAEKIETTSTGVDVTGRIDLDDANLQLKQAGDQLRVQTVSGWGGFGPQNTSFCHITTDRSRFYMNEPLEVDGTISIYNGNVSLGGSGTIAGNTWANGTFHLGTSSSGWAMDPNEFYNASDAIIGTITGNLSLNPKAGNITTARPFVSTSTISCTTITATTLAGAATAALKTNSTTDTNNIWIRNTAPTIYFRDTDHRGAMIHNNSNLLYVLRGSQATDSTSWATTGNGWPLTINLTNNDATFSGNVTAYSDARLKENVEPIGITMDQFKSIEAKRFDWKVDSKHDVGFIAQDVEAAGLVEVVKEHEERDPETGELIDTYKTLDYSRMVPFLWDIVQKQQVQIDELKEALNNGSSN